MWNGKMRQVSSILSLFMLFPVAFSSGLYARQAAALVTLVALKLTLKSALGCGFAVAKVTALLVWNSQERKPCVWGFF